MKNLFAPIFLLFSVALSSDVLIAKEAPVPDSIIVITSDKKPLSNIDDVKHILQQVGGILEIHNLDAVDSFEQRFSKDLSSNEDEARKLFEQRMSDYGVKKFETEIINAYQGLFNSLVYEVERYPVIIFNKTEAIYGVTDLKAALFKYQSWRLGNEQ